MIITPSIPLELETILGSQMGYSVVPGAPNNLPNNFTAARRRLERKSNATKGSQGLIHLNNASLSPARHGTDSLVNIVGGTNTAPVEIIVTGGINHDFTLASGVAIFNFESAWGNVLKVKSGAHAVFEVFDPYKITVYAEEGARASVIYASDPREQSFRFSLIGTGQASYYRRTHEGAIVAVGV